MFRGGATRCSLKQSAGMVVLRLIIAPLSMRDENRERKEYSKEKKRYEKYLRGQQQQQQKQEDQEAMLPAGASMPTVPPGAVDGTTDGTTERPSRLGRFARRLCGVASCLRTRERKAYTALPPVQPPRRMPHWQRERPRPTPAWTKRGGTTRAVSAYMYPEGYSPGAAAAGMRRPGSESRSISPYRTRAWATTAEGREMLAAARRRRRRDGGRRMSLTREGGTGTRCVVDRDDMPAQYKRMNPY